LTNEVLQGIRVIKFFVWESKFLKQISEVRKNELAMLKKLSMIRATNMLIWVMMPLLVRRIVEYFVKTHPFFLADLGG
jgi:ATP-binding cassette subfamily C (CFTR/MRP) protein 1